MRPMLIYWSRSADLTVAERIRERSLLLMYSSRLSNSNERSDPLRNSWVCWTRPLSAIASWSQVYRNACRSSQSEVFIMPLMLLI